ncbi:hypothetical protein [Pontibacter sp. G13]|uniref:hypothetical protein n=1 Tax=Pontibacter sp. G13 TaxID=3074898 RepID=UPI002889E070|nr:hypothetical protein [Pontibacter sp. G13]WNJ17012.1 hypothetical protein RJD25_19330 [Pontibacter sp. G13]
MAVWTWMMCAALLLSGISPAYLDEMDSPQTRVNQIRYEIPQSLRDEVLLIAHYEEFPEDPEASPARKRLISDHNARARHANAILQKILDKHYPYPYKLVDLTEVNILARQGGQFYLDLAMLPKKTDQPRPETMAPTYERYVSSLQMYSNNFDEFQFYFYIRNLRNDNAYFPKVAKGYDDAEKGMKDFLKRVAKSL